MNTNTKTTIVYNTEDIEGIEVRRRYKKGRFTSMKLINTLNDRRDNPDLLDLLGSMSKGARDLFLIIKNEMNYKTYIAYLDGSELSRGQQNKRNQAYKELMYIGLVKKLPCTGLKNNLGIDMKFSVGSYMMSPEYIYPSKNYVEAIKHIWRQLE